MSFKLTRVPGTSVVGPSLMFHNEKGGVYAQIAVLLANDKQRVITLIADALELVTHLAGLTLPEEEAVGQGVSVDDFLAEVDDDRLCNEYAALAEMIRNSRRILA